MSYTIITKNNEKSVKTEFSYDILLLQEKIKIKMLFNSKPKFGTPQSFVQSLLYSSGEEMTVRQIQKRIRNSMMRDAYQGLSDDINYLLKLLMWMDAKRWVYMKQVGNQWVFYYDK